MHAWNWAHGISENIFLRPAVAILEILVLLWGASKVQNASYPQIQANCSGQFNIVDFFLSGCLKRYNCSMLADQVGSALQILRGREALTHMGHRKGSAWRARPHSSLVKR
jgi:hypothetical protein